MPLSLRSRARSADSVATSSLRSTSLADGKHEGGDGVKPDPDTGRSETGRGAAVEQLLAARGPRPMQAAIPLARSRPDGGDLLQAALGRLPPNQWRGAS